MHIYTVTTCRPCGPTLQHTPITYLLLCVYAKGAGYQDSGTLLGVKGLGPHTDVTAACLSHDLFPMTFALSAR